MRIAEVRQCEKRGSGRMKGWTTSITPTIIAADIIGVMLFHSAGIHCMESLNLIPEPRRKVLHLFFISLGQIQLQVMSNMAVSPHDLFDFRCAALIKSALLPEQDKELFVVALALESKQPSMARGRSG